MINIVVPFSALSWRRKNWYWCNSGNFFPQQEVVVAYCRGSTLEVGKLENKVIQYVVVVVRRGGRSSSHVEFPWRRRRHGGKVRTLPAVESRRRSGKKHRAASAGMSTHHQSCPLEKKERQWHAGHRPRARLSDQTPCPQDKEKINACFTPANRDARA